MDEKDNREEVNFNKNDNNEIACAIFVLFALIVYIVYVIILIFLICSLICHMFNNPDLTLTWNLIWLINKYTPFTIYVCAFIVFRTIGKLISSPKSNNN